MEIVVGGETFEVRERAGEPGAYHCDWVSGPNPGYGFSCFFMHAVLEGAEFMHAVLEGAEPGPFDVHAALRDAIARFLAGIDPETGYMAD